ncbi:hypothetical protein [Bacillus altitudinis]
MNEHMKTEGKSAVKNKKELETLDTQRFLALLQLFPLCFEGKGYGHKCSEIIDFEKL